MTKILVVDDDPSITNLVSAYLKPEGYEIFIASDGTAGLKAARAFKPDLIILDVMLPDLDGFEVCRRLRTDPKTSSIPIIIITARSLTADKIVGLTAGADEKFACVLELALTGEADVRDDEVPTISQYFLGAKRRQAVAVTRCDGRELCGGVRHCLHPPAIAGMRRSYTLAGLRDARLDRRFRHLSRIRADENVSAFTWASANQTQGTVSLTAAKPA